MFENLTLTRKYTGYCAFGKFLSDFATGRKVLYRSDFPESIADLKRLGVTRIEVIYEFRTHQTAPVIRLLRTTPGRPPKSIISCSNLTDSAQ